MEYSVFVLVCVCMCSVGVALTRGHGKHLFKGNVTLEAGNFNFSLLLFFSLFLIHTIIFQNILLRNDCIALYRKQSATIV